MNVSLSESAGKGTWKQVFAADAPPQTALSIVQKQQLRDSHIYQSQSFSCFCYFSIDTQTLNGVEINKTLP